MLQVYTAIYLYRNLAQLRGGFFFVIFFGIPPPPCQNDGPLDLRSCVTWEVIAKVFASKVVARKGQEISRKPMVKALVWVTPSIARWGNSMDPWMILC